MKWDLKGGISIDADSGTLRYVLWCYGSVCHQPFTFIQIGCGHTVVYVVLVMLCLFSRLMRWCKDFLRRMLGICWVVFRVHWRMGVQLGVIQILLQWYLSDNYALSQMTSLRSLMRIKKSISFRVITFSPRSSGYNFPISWTDLLTTGYKKGEFFRWREFPAVLALSECSRFLAKIAFLSFPQKKKPTNSIKRHAHDRNNENAAGSYLVSSFYKKWNDVFAARHNPHRALLGITPVFHCVHQFWPITLSLELWMYSNWTNFHHTIVGHCSYATKDLL